MTVAIQGRDQVALLRYEAQRRPEVAAVLNDIDSYTVDDIGRMKLPLPWYRSALLEVKRRAELARLGQNIEDYIVEGRVPDPDGWIHQYLGETQFYASIQINYGALYFLQDDGVLWFDTVRTHATEALIRASKRISRDTKLGYKSALRDHRLRSNPNAPVIQLDGVPGSVTDSQPLSHLGVRIQR
ncbi:MAG: hypothetical protein EOP83_04665 [Verrucomicrobiaceae bacterium]|nr:MAG: hypothetical protein EOP83_04665 [Verrucomicrobiaceae bacterium]